MMPGVRSNASCQTRRPLSGNDRWNSPLMLIACVVFSTSSIGVSPVTWIVSSIAPSFSVTST